MWPESPWSNRKNYSNSQHKCRFFTSMQNGRLISKRFTLWGWDWCDSWNSLASLTILSVRYSDLFVPWALDLCLVNNMQTTMHCPFCYYHFCLKSRLNRVNTLHAESFMQEVSLPFAVPLWFSKVCWSSAAGFQSTVSRLFLSSPHFLSDLKSLAATLCFYTLITIKNEISCQ